MNNWTVLYANCLSKSSLWFSPHTISPSYVWASLRNACRSEHIRRITSDSETEAVPRADESTHKTFTPLWSNVWTNYVYILFCLREISHLCTLLLYIFQELRYRMTEAHLCMFWCDKTEDMCVARLWFRVGRRIGRLNGVDIISHGQLRVVVWWLWTGLVPHTPHTMHISQEYRVYDRS